MGSMFASSPIIPRGRTEHSALITISAAISTDTTGHTSHFSLVPKTFSHSWDCFAFEALPQSQRKTTAEDEGRRSFWKSLNSGGGLTELLKVSKRIPITNVREEASILEVCEKAFHLMYAPVLIPSIWLCWWARSLFVLVHHRDQLGPSFSCFRNSYIFLKRSGESQRFIYI